MVRPLQLGVAMAQQAAAVGATAATDEVARAHARLLADKGLQFDFGAPPPPPPKPPNWDFSFLKPIAEFLGSLGPAVQWIFWGALALAVLAILLFIGRELIRVRFPARKAPPPAEAPAWRPTETQARTLIEDADQLAAQGRFAEAVRLLLFRSIEHIQGKRPNLVRPALTSRDIAALRELPEAARPAFQVLAQVVEQSFFGGRPVDAEGFAACRQAYGDFALPGAWR